MKISIKNYLQKKRKIVLIIIVSIISAIFIGVWILFGKEAKDFWYHFDRSYYYNDSIILFYGEGCEHCDTVDNFIESNMIAEKVSFERLEVFNDKINANILLNKTQICGFEYERVGVPFLWDGENKRCFMGYVDIINFFDSYAKSF